jgi:hypothetical protein
LSTTCSDSEARSTKLNSGKEGAMKKKKNSEFSKRSDATSTEKEP